MTILFLVFRIVLGEENKNKTHIAVRAKLGRKDKLYTLGRYLKPNM